MQTQEHDQQKPSRYGIIWTQSWILSTLQKQDLDLKSELMMLIEDFKIDMNNSHKEMPGNTGK